MARGITDVDSGGASVQIGQWQLNVSFPVLSRRWTATDITTTQHKPTRPTSTNSTTTTLTNLYLQSSNYPSIQIKTTQTTQQIEPCLFHYPRDPSSPSQPAAPKPQPRRSYDAPTTTNSQEASRRRRALVELAPDSRGARDLVNSPLEHRRTRRQSRYDTKATKATRNQP